MADICNLCGGEDIKVESIYENHIRPIFTLEMAESLRDGELFSCGVDGICEHCGLVHVGIDNMFNFIGIFLDSPPEIIGHINKETFDLIINYER